MKQLVGQPASHSNDQVVAALSHKILNSELKLKVKSSGIKDVSGRQGWQNAENQFRPFVMSLKFIDDKIGEIGLKAK